MAEEQHATNTADVINHAIDKASEGLAQIAHSLSTAAPQAWAIACHGVYAKGMAQLIVGAFCTVAFVILWSAALWGITKCIAAEKEDSDSGIRWLFLIIPAGLAGGAFLMAACANGLDSDAWTRVLSPEGYLAQQILTKALN